MIGYVGRRLLLIIPTLLGIMLVNFIIAQAAPGGPIQQIISQMRGEASDLSARLGEGTDGFRQEQRFSGDNSDYRGAQGVDPDFIERLEKQFGFDKPAYERFLIMLKNYLKFDFGKSYFRDKTVTEIVRSKLPVSVSLGLWTTLLVYLISIPLGIKKAVTDGSKFDVATSAAVIVAYAVPSFLFALFLMILFAGGGFFKIFPLRGLFSEGWDDFNLLDKLTDYFWHLCLPLLAMVISGFAKLTLLTKNSFLDEINKQYVVTARAKGLEENKILYGHVFRNAMLIVIAGFPAAFVHILFTSSLLVEVLFSLDGLGLLGFEAAMSRDYPVMFGCLYMFTLLGMFLHLASDITYMIVDRRIDLSAAKI